ncbi:YjiH family protein [Chromobacterium haemolyticum]|uniref:YjiH family protein n=1 Tax=Chromobacterium haemolyticum TaxID=394935 RepID=UPI0009D9C70C|nr:YjiH family protein [Chromobacterium haemolyticum]OQS36359.1 histidine transporter [Chromobacterium haemolyticum]PTU70045.1 histidine transporter [Chromobacterium haemolyticum]
MSVEHSLPFSPNNVIALLRLLTYSLIGILLFFLPLEIAGNSTIPLDHAASYLANAQRELAVTLVMLLIAYGSIAPFVSGRWRVSAVNIVFSLLKLAGLALAILYLTRLGPSLLFEKDMLPFLFDKLALTVGLIVPLGAAALAFLIGFGLLELVGVLMQPVMRPIWRTPGHSAIDAVASFVGSYSVGLLITNRVFLEGKYTIREAAIIATGFSTVSAAFMVIVAKTLGLMPIWNFYFWSTLVVAFTVTAITAWLPPISRMDNQGGVRDELPAGMTRWQAALAAGLRQAKAAPSLTRVLIVNLRDGLAMAGAVVPSILSVGLIGLLLARYTPLFDVLGLLLAPVAWLAGLSEPMLTGKALAAGLAEMFLPAILLKDADLLVRFVAAVVSVSSVLFFSASIPCILATRIPLSVRHLVLIWLLRTVLGILLAAGIGHLALWQGWLG